MNYCQLKRIMKLKMALIAVSGGFLVFLFLVFDSRIKSSAQHKLKYFWSLDYSDSARHPNMTIADINDVNSMNVYSEKAIFKTSTVNLSIFSRIIGQFDWDGYATSVQKIPLNITDIESRMETLMHLTFQFLIMEPKVPINHDCQPPTLSLSAINCSNYGIGTAFTGNVNVTPRKVGILVQFGFDVDVLEIYLNEMYDVVDQFFITESTKSHFRALAKPLMWEQVKEQSRFLKFRDKITHFIIDDVENAKVTHTYKNSTKLIEEKHIWDMEKMQEFLRWKKFLEWNGEYKMFSDSDLIGFGDADEIPARKMVYIMKNCDLKKDILDFGIWFPFGNIENSFASNFPLPGHQYTLGDPTFWKLKAAMNLPKNKIPGRQRGRSGSYILGGIHMTHYGYLPHQFVRDLSCTECSPWPIKKIQSIKTKILSDEIRQLEIEHGAIPERNLVRTVKLISILDKMRNIAILPWFYVCNRERYPVWEGRHDTRLD